MSKKTKTIEIDGIGLVTLSARGCGWMEENADSTFAAMQEEGFKNKVAAGRKIVHDSLQKNHPELTMERIKDELLVSEVSDLASQVMALSGLSAPGEVALENPSQEGSSAS